MNTIIKTQYGYVAFTPTDINHIYIEIAPTSPELNPNGHKYSLPFTLRGVSYDGSIHVYRHSNGSFAPGLPSGSDWDRRQSISIQRRDPTRPRNNIASDTAQRNILDTLIPLVNTWAAANPYILDAAQQEHTRAQLARLQQTRADLLQSLAEVDTQIAALQQTLAPVPLTTDGL